MECYRAAWIQSLGSDFIPIAHRLQSLGVDGSMLTVEGITALSDEIPDTELYDRLKREIDRHLTAESAQSRPVLGDEKTPPIVAVTPTPTQAPTVAESQFAQAINRAAPSASGVSVNVNLPQPLLPATVNRIENELSGMAERLERAAAQASTPVIHVTANIAAVGSNNTFNKVVPIEELSRTRDDVVNAIKASNAELKAANANQTNKVDQIQHKIDLIVSNLMASNAHLQQQLAEEQQLRAATTRELTDLKKLFLDNPELQQARKELKAALATQTDLSQRLMAAEDLVAEMLRIKSELKTRKPHEWSAAAVLHWVELFARDDKSAQLTEFVRTLTVRSTTADAVTGSVFISLTVRQLKSLGLTHSDTIVLFMECMDDLKSAASKASGDSKSNLH